MEEFIPENKNQEQNSKSIPSDMAEENFFSKKIISLLIGLLFVVIVVSGGTYLFLVSKVKTNKTKPPVVATKVSPTPVKNPTKKSELPKQENKTASSSFGKGAKVYTDSLFGYSIQIPQNMETFRRVGNDTAYQIAIRKIGETDAPIVIGTQQNLTGENLNEWVNTEFGNNAQRERKTVGGVEALKVGNDLSQSITYVFMNKSNVYEFSVSTINPEYVSIFNQILSSVTFTSK